MNLWCNHILLFHRTAFQLIPRQHLCVQILLDIMLIWKREMKKKLVKNILYLIRNDDFAQMKRILIHLEQQCMLYILVAAVRPTGATIIFLFNLFETIKINSGCFLVAKLLSFNQRKKESNFYWMWVWVCVVVVVSDGWNHVPKCQSVQNIKHLNSQQLILIKWTTVISSFFMNGISNDFRARWKRPRGVKRRESEHYGF